MVWVALDITQGILYVVKSNVQNSVTDITAALAPKIKKRQRSVRTSTDKDLVTLPF